MRFTKMHGIGNDYVYVNGFEERVDDPAALAPKVADRHRGIGGDGLIMVLPSERADVRMRMFNADGTESEMCGNGVRCVAKLAYDHGLSTRNPMRVETGRGVLTLALELGADGKVAQVEVNMGPPILDLAEIPVDAAHLSEQGNHEYRMGLSDQNAPAADARAVDRRHLGQRPALVNATFVSMGNPHAVIFVDDVKAVPLARQGPLVEHHKAFPRRINAHWASVASPTELTMRTWERGSGITQACGTGACAVCVAGVLTGRTGRQVVAHLPGGDLRLEWREADNNVYMTGPATEVFRGEWNG